MKTEQRHEEEVKKARREVFYKLYTLPWLLLVILLTGVSVSGIQEIKRLNEELWKERLIKMEQELVARVKPIERENLINITNVVEIVKTNVVETIEEREIFTMGNYELGKKIGIDIEKELKRKIKEYLEKEMGRRIGLEMGIRTDRIIESEFEGWKMFNRN